MRYRGKALQFWRNLWRELDPPGEIDVAGPITTVFDNSRLSTIGAALGQAEGFLRAGSSNVHVANGDLFSSFDPYLSVDFFSPGSRDQYRMWLMDMFCTTNDATDFGQANFGLSYSGVSVQPTFTAADVLIGSFTPPRSPPIQSAGVIGVVPAARAALPLYIPVGTTFRQASTADTSGTVTINFNWVLWIGPRGTTPPGGY